MFCYILIYVFLMYCYGNKVLNWILNWGIDILMWALYDFQGFALWILENHHCHISGVFPHPTSALSPPYQINWANLICACSHISIRSLHGRPFAERASNWESNKLGCYITMYLPIARSVVLRRRNWTIIDLLGNVFIHNAARSRLSPQMVKPCKERIVQCTEHLPVCS